VFESRSGRLLESPGHRLFLGLFAVAEQHVTSSAAGVLNATTPLWTLVIAFATGHERRISAFKAAGFVIGMAGTLLIFSPWRSGGQIASAGGLACLAASASYGVSYVYMDRFLARRHPAAGPVRGQLIMAAALLAIVTPFDGLQQVHLRWDAVLALLVLGAFGTGIAYILNYRLITDEGTTASVVNYALPMWRSSSAPPSCPTASPRRSSWACSLSWRA
jgi:drug/metabolite transporter (DMT)-like permease